MNEKPHMNDTPVILVCYNRPKHTDQVLRALEMHRVQKLYIFGDAPKKPEHEPLVQQTRALVESVRWTRPEILYNDHNRGCAGTVVSAIDYVLDRHDRMILLEDDCVPKRTFFDYMHKCLNAYESNEKVFGINGYSVPVPRDIQEKYPYDVYFYPRIGCWAWGTWKRAWQYNDRDIRRVYDRTRASGIDLLQGGTDIPGEVESVIRGDLDAWTLNWVLSVYLRGGCFVYPIVSQMMGIGYDSAALHSAERARFLYLKDERAVRRLPKDVILDPDLIDNYNDYFGNPRTGRKTSTLYDMKHNWREIERYAQPFPENTSPADKDLNIVHVCTFDYGGAGNAAYRLHRGMRQIGLDSRMLVLIKKTDDPSVTAVAGGRGAALWSQYELGLEQTLREQYPHKPHEYELFSNPFSAVDITQHELIRKADVINLHWIAGLVDMEKLAKSLPGKKIIWTLHDMNAFTGGCHYSWQCDKYARRCGACFQLNSTQQTDASTYIQTHKRGVFESLDLNIVTPSRWLAECARKSSILSGVPVHTIANGIPVDEFTPFDRGRLRVQLNIPADKKLLLFGAIDIKNSRKGSDLLLNALEKLARAVDPSKIMLGFFGKMPPDLKIHAPFAVYDFGSIADIKTLAMVYSVADAVIVPSRHDNLPNIVVESLACGTPVIGSRVGGIPDIIEHGKTGFLIDPARSGDIIEAVKWICSLDEASARAVSWHCRRKAVTDYSWTMQAFLYYELYRAAGSSRKARTVPVCLPEHYDYQVSAVVSTYNSEKFIRGCLQDLVEQSLFKQGRLEIVVVDSASPQNERAIVQEYRARYGHIKYIRTHEREGIYAAWNRGIKAASGRYITNANTDDRHHPEMLERLAAVLDAEPEVAAVYSPFYLTPRENETWDTKTAEAVSHWQIPFDRSVLLERYYLGPQPVWRKSVHDEYGYFDPSLKVCGDYEFFLRISQTRKIKQHPEIMGLYLCSDNSLERSAGTKDAEDRRIQSLYAKNLDKIVRRPFAAAPEFSIVMRNYNKARYIAESIECILAQTFTEWELIIVDDASTDKSLEVIQRYLSDPRIHLIRHDQNKGVGAAALTGIHNVSSPYFGILDSDDVLTPDTIETMYTAHVEHPDCGFIYSQFELCDEHLRTQSLGYCKPLPEGQSNLGLDWVSAFRTFKLREYLKTSGHDTSLDQAEDKDIIYKMEEVTRLHFVDRVLYRYRGLPESQVYNLKKILFGRLAHAYVKMNAVIRRSRLARFHGQLSPAEYLTGQIRALMHTDKYVIEIVNLIRLSRDRILLNTRMAHSPDDLSEDAFILWTVENVGFRELAECSRDLLTIKPFVTVYMPTYNQARYLPRAIESVLNQTYTHYEFIIVDDGSTDDTADIVARYADKRIRYIHQPNAGTAAAINTAIRNASAYYLLGVDSDDWIPPQYLENMVRFAMDHPEADHYYPEQMVLVNEDGSPTGQAWHYPDYTDSTFLPHLIFDQGRGLIPMNAGTLRQKNLFARLGMYPDVDNPEDFVYLARNAVKIRFKAVRDCGPYYYRRMNTGKSMDYAGKNRVIARTLYEMTTLYTPEQLCPQLTDVRDSDTKHRLFYEYAMKTFCKHAQAHSGRGGEYFSRYGDIFRQKLVKLSSERPIINSEGDPVSVPESPARPIRDVEPIAGYRQQAANVAWPAP